MSDKKAMVVDDSGIVRRVSRGIMESIGYTVCEAEDGQKALEVFTANMPSIILLDWHMPVMNGIEFLKVLRARPDGQDVKIIFCTTETQLDSIQDAITSGANEYVMKPFDEDIIRGKLEQLGLL